MSIAEHVATLENGTDEAKEKAAAALCELAFHPDNHSPIVEAGAVPPLVELLRSGGMLNKLQAMNAFSILGMNANLNVWVACAEAGAIPILVELLRNGRAEEKGAAAGSLRVIAVDNQSAIAEAGGLD